jgi:hypothetical protein
MALNKEFKPIYQSISKKILDPTKYDLLHKKILGQLVQTPILTFCYNIERWS